ncbi:hypothetical protein Tco_0058527 [Tanacetum coccineum]
MSYLYAYSSQPTVIPQTFQTLTLPDPNWHVDTGASSHLADFPVKDYETRRILLRCNSTEDLYPVRHQPPLSTPLALLTFSHSTWQRRLGHPGDDVLRKLESRHLISSHGSKLSNLFHAC